MNLRLHFLACKTEILLPLPGNSWEGDPVVMVLQTVKVCTMCGIVMTKIGRWFFFGSVSLECWGHPPFTFYSHILFLNLAYFGLGIKWPMEPANLCSCPDSSMSQHLCSLLQLICPLPVPATGPWPRPKIPQSPFPFKFLLKTWHLAF